MPAAILATLMLTHTHHCQAQTGGGPPSTVASTSMAPCHAVRGKQCWGHPALSLSKGFWRSLLLVAMLAGGQSNYTRGTFGPGELRNYSVTPQPIAVPGPWDSVSVGPGLTCAIKSQDRSAWCFVSDGSSACIHRPAQLMCTLAVCRETKLLHSVLDACWTQTRQLLVASIQQRHGYQSMWGRPTLAQSHRTAAFGAGK